MTDSCICCANGNDLPDGEECMACGREGRPLLAAAPKFKEKPSVRDARLIAEMNIPPLPKRGFA